MKNHARTIYFGGRHAKGIAGGVANVVRGESVGRLYCHPNICRRKIQLCEVSVNSLVKQTRTVIQRFRRSAGA